MSQSEQVWDLSAGSGYVNGEINFDTANPNTNTDGMGFSAGIGGGREEDGPSVSVSAKQITDGTST